MKPETLAGALAHWAVERPERLAYRFLEFESGRASDVTFGELDRRARAVGRLLADRVEPGDRVVLIYPSSIDYIAALLGCFYSGAVAVPVYPPVTGRMAETYQLIAADSEPSLVLTNSEVISGFRKIQRIQALQKNRWLRGISRYLFKELADLPLPDSGSIEWLKTDELDASSAEGWTPPHVSGKDLALLQYTSGSTGRPKGVMISHGNLIANEDAIGGVFEGNTEEDSGLGWLPLYHDMGLIGNILHPLYIGGTFRFFSPLEFVQKPVRWLQAISDHRATISGGPNFAYELCLKKVTDQDIEGLDLSCWRVAFDGAEPVRKATLDAFAERFSRCGFRKDAFRPCYGMAENTLITACRLRNASLRFSLPPGSATQGAAQSELVSCGSPLENQQIVIVDPETRERCEDRHPGEIWLAGPSAAQGYWNNPQATEETFRAFLADGEGPFLRTGDLGFLDENELFVTGRLKDLIILNGRNYHPHDIEDTAEKAHHALRRGCCVAFSVDDGAQERLVVVQEAKKTKIDLEAMLLDMLKAIARDHRLKVHEIVLTAAGSIPKTTSGKLRRSACKEAFLSGSLTVLARLGGVPAEETEAARNASRAREGLVSEEVPPDELLLRARLKSLIARAADAKLGEIADDDRVLDLGIDSLAAVELLDALELEMSISLSPEELMENPTLAEFSRRLLEKQRRRGPAAISTLSEGGYSLFASEGALLREIDKGLPVNLVVQGQKLRELTIEGRAVADFASLNYLGMDLRREVIDAIQPAVERWGVHPSWSRAVASPGIYEQLEQELAALVEAPIVSVFPSISLLHVGVLPLLAGSHGALFVDHSAHHSLQDACELARARGARQVTIRHNDLEMLERKLEEHQERSPKLIVLDGVYSMSGEYADLPAYSALAKKHDACLYVDDAHGFGILGARPDAELPYGYGGGGLVRHHGLDYRDDRVIYVAGLSKAFSTYGAFITCFDEEMRKRIRLAAPYIFSGPMPTASLASGLAGLAVNRQSGDTIRKRVWSLTRRLVDGLAQVGMATDNWKYFPIVFVPIGSVKKTLFAWHELWKSGFLITPGVFPAAPIDRGGVRISLTSDNTEAQVDGLVDALTSIHRSVEGAGPPTSRT